jgi:hypothetical protein
MTVAAYSTDVMDEELHIYSSHHCTMIGGSIDRQQQIHQKSALKKAGL